MGLFGAVIVMGGIAIGLGALVLLDYLSERSQRKHEQNAK